MTRSGVRFPSAPPNCLPVGDPTREAALALITAVLTRNTSADVALDALSAIDMRDKAAAHRLAATVLRRTGTLDAVLQMFLPKEPPQPVRFILWLGAAAVLFLQVPPHAAVGTAVELAKTKKLSPFCGLINAVLRKIASGGPELLEALDMPRLDTPSWAWASWGNEARAIATAHQNEAPLDITLKPGCTPPQGGISWERLPTGSYRFPPGTSVPNLPGFSEGNFWVQDAAAALPAVFLNVKPGERVLDLCAAPGGKTAQLAAAGGVVTAIDRDASRLDTLRGNLRRLNLTAELIHADATKWQPQERFPAILLDAPCSATGTVRRHPDLLHLRRPGDITTLIGLQDKLLDAAASFLAPGGRLVYAVCSLQPQEGVQRVNAAATRLGLQHDSLSLAALSEAVTPEKNIRTHPGLWSDRGGMDGFFIARLIKPG
jgi:16S rRNA (cytosine967-C5)-methyltransferase